MLRLRIGVCVLLGSCLSWASPERLPLPVRAAQIQNQEQPPPDEPTDQFFSGIVISLSSDKLTVARTVLGTTSSFRVFAITPDTRVEGKLRVKVRVTVQFATKEEVDWAIHIIVRAPQPKK